MGDLSCPAGGAGRREEDGLEKEIIAFWQEMGRDFYYFESLATAIAFPSAFKEKSLF